MMRSIESASSVFYHSQEEEPAKTEVDSQGSHREAPSGGLFDSYHDSMINSSSVITEPHLMGKNVEFTQLHAS